MTALTGERALERAIDALGGLQSVGHMLRPELEPDAAGRWLSHCLQPRKRDKLSIAQILLIFREANSKGEHEGFEAWSRGCGYRAGQPITPESELAELQKRAMRTLRESQDAQRELFERMRAAGIKIDE
jgi:hypothetical protein